MIYLLEKNNITLKNREFYRKYISHKLMHDLPAILLRQVVFFFYRKLRSDIGLRDWSYVQILSEFKIL